MLRYVKPACFALSLLGFGLGPSVGNAQEVVRSHGWAIHSEIKYPKNFSHFDYVNPDAPKGGTVVFGAPDTFDSLNPFIIKGNPGAGSSAIYDTLMTSSMDEPNSEYGLLAEWIEVATDDKGVITDVRFKLHDTARFHDGVPVRASDVVWTFNTLREKGSPLYRYYYANVESVKSLDDLTVEFHMTPGENVEMPVILGQLPVLPEHYWADKDFDKTTLDPPLGSGPYKIGAVRPGQSVTLERVPDYWGKDLPVNVGQNNFDTIRYEYFRDRTVLLEALKAGTLDWRSENSAKNWATAYDVPAVKDGRLIKREFANQRGAGMQAYVMNTRKPIFSDIKVREAMTYLWDFEWVNKTIMFGAYTRTDSYFENSDLEATGLPGPEELKVLEPLRDELPPRVFTEDYAPPVTDGSGNNRPQLREALKLLNEAGWEIKDGVLTQTSTGAPFEFEVLLNQDLLTPHTQALVRGVERLGGKVSIRVVDAAQYQSRVDNFDFDMIIGGWGQSMSPGNEQREFWSTAAADRQGSRNTAGIKNPAIDTLIEDLISSPNRDVLVARTHALDRALLWNFYVIPMYHSKVDRIAYWNRFGFPETPPMQGTSPNFWWIDADLDAALQRNGRK
ncbi:MAG: extracellular solute-binding protein [Alphaproteobacteria bacterium]|nr:extracellular solute-binding protein [Alphaproteobacteria bacterium]